MDKRIFLEIYTDGFLANIARRHTEFWEEGFVVSLPIFNTTVTRFKSDKLKLYQ